MISTASAAESLAAKLDYQIGCRLRGCYLIWKDTTYEERLAHGLAFIDLQAQLHAVSGSERYTCPWAADELYGVLGGAPTPLEHAVKAIHRHGKPKTLNSRQTIGTIDAGIKHVLTLEEVLASRARPVDSSVCAPRSKSPKAQEYEWVRKEEQRLHCGRRR